MIKDRPLPTPEAIDRIRSFGEKAIIAFFDEVPIEAFRHFVDFLPPVPGFRKNSTAGIKQQKQILAKRLTSKTPDDRDQRALYVIWRGWASERLGDADRVHEAFERLEAAGGKVSKPPNGEASDSEAPSVVLFSELKQMSADNLCPREDIRRLFEFSPFSADQAVTDLIDQSKAAADIERDATITELPKRLRKDEEEIKALRDRIDALSEQVKAAKPSTDDTPAKLAEFGKELAAHNEALARLRGSVDQAVADIKANYEETSGIVRDLESLRRQVQGLSAPQPMTPSVSSESIAALKADVSKLAAGLAALSQKVAERPAPAPFPTEPFERQIESLTSRLNEIEQSRVSPTELAGLAFRVDALESKSKTPAAPTHQEPASIAVDVKAPQPHAGALPAFRLGRDGAAKPQKLSDHTKTAETLTEALQRTGLKKSAAQVFSEDIVAALSCNQVVFFKGSLGSAVASACANAIASGRAWSISVPVGLTDGGLLRASIQNFLEDAPQDVTAIILEGINRTSLDALRDGLSGSQNVALFATVFDGLASLPVESAYFEHGPIFDLDCLEWRSRAEIEAAPVHGNLSVETNVSIRRELHAGAVNADEPLRLLRKYLSKRNVRIERTIVAAFAALSHMRASNAPVTPIHSLAFGWLVPLWIALGLSADEADSELDGGKLDASTTDARIAELLRAGGFARAAKDGSL